MAEAPVVFIKDKQATRKPEIRCESRVLPAYRAGTTWQRGTHLRPEWT